VLWAFADPKGGQTTRAVSGDGNSEIGVNQHELTIWPLKLFKRRGGAARIRHQSTASLGGMGDATDASRSFIILEEGKKEGMSRGFLRI